MFEKLEKEEKNPWLDLGRLEPAAIQYYSPMLLVSQDSVPKKIKNYMSKP